MAKERDVTLRSSEDDGAAKTVEEARPKEDAPPRRKPSEAEVRDSVADAETAKTCSKLVEAFDSSRVRGETRETPATAVDENAPGASLRARGNDAMRRGDFALAHGFYTEALEAARDDDANLRAVVFCNRALASHKLGEYDSAMCDAKRAEELAPRWSKVKHRLAEACLRMGSYALAVSYARRGEKEQLEEGDFSKSFRDLLDEIAVSAAEDGSVVGFDGRLIFVRSAGEEAWLGRAAPLNAAFDELENEMPDPVFGGGGGEGKGKGVENTPIHARSLPDALKKAQDGDRILLLRGIHNGCGQVVDVDKRVIIRGEGTFREATLDARNNSPIFRITRPCVVQNVDIDFTGFSEAIRVVGDARVKPFIENCRVKCSGNDAVAVGKQSAPTFRNCIFTGKKVGARAYAHATPSFIDCHFTKCGMVGVLAMKESRVVMYGCALQDNEEDGLVAMERANVIASKCLIERNKGPGVDVSQEAKIVASECEIEGNVGGLWLWENGRAQFSRCRIEGGKSHAVLVDVDADAHCRECEIVGVVHASEKGIERVRGRGTVVKPLETPTSLPREIAGPFKFDPCPYTRKQ
jgi:tetratricopeptide (TPR) repeat protein